MSADDLLVLWYFLKTPSFAASVKAVLMVKNSIKYNS